MESYFILSMFEWKVSIDTREVRLLDSQDMDYRVKFQKDKYDCNCQNTIAPTGAYCNETQLSPCWETTKKIMKVLDFFSFLNESVGGLECI
jgi:hypothetical protein